MLERTPDNLSMYWVTRDNMGYSPKHNFIERSVLNVLWESRGMVCLVGTMKRSLGRSVCVSLKAQRMGFQYIQRKEPSWAELQVISAVHPDVTDPVLHSSIKSGFLAWVFVVAYFLKFPTHFHRGHESHTFVGKETRRVADHSVIIRFLWKVSILLFLFITAVIRKRASLCRVDTGWYCFLCNSLSLKTRVSVCSWESFQIPVSLLKR